MGILSWLIVGAIAGLLAKAISPGPEPHGAVVTVVLGIVGACIGGFLFNMFGHHGAHGVDLYSIMVATIGAVILLALYKSTARSAY